MPPKVKYKTIKTSLKSIINDDKYINMINSVVIKSNKIVSDIYLFIKLYILYLYKNNIDIPILNNEFIRYVSSVLCKKSIKGRKPKNIQLLEGLNEFYINHFKPIHNHKKHKAEHMTDIVHYLCNYIEVSIKNNISLYFCKRLYKFIRISSKIKNVYTLYSCIFENKERDECYKKWYDKHINDIIPDTIENNIAYDCKKNPYKYIPCMIYMNMYYERHNNKVDKKLVNVTDENQIKKINKKKYRLFQTIPLRTDFKPKYITIDYKILKNFFIRCDHKNMTKEKAWTTVFNMEHKIFVTMIKKGYELDYIQTDGVSCSILFKKDVQTNSLPNTKIIIPYVDKNTIYDINLKKVICVDPGKKDLAYMMNNKGIILKYSNGRKKYESFSTSCKRIENDMKKKQKIQKIENDLSQFNVCTVNYKKFKEYIRVRHEVHKKVRKFYEQVLFRKFRWRIYTNTQRTLSNFLNRIESTYGKDPTIVIGDWSNSCMKGCEPTMGESLKRLISKRYKTYLIDEYNTSKLCNFCHNPLENAIIKKKKIYRLLTCPTCNSKCFQNIGLESHDRHYFRYYMNRDTNACKNMMYILKQMKCHRGRRPSSYDRFSGNRKPVYS